jgi:hypothetical protein
MSNQPQLRSASFSADAPVTTSSVTPEVLLDMSLLTTTYVNYFHACGSPRELILDFGLHSDLRLSSGPEPVHVTQRLIMPMTTAKQLLEFLQMLIRAQENASALIQGTPPRPNPTPCQPAS